MEKEQVPVESYEENSIDEIDQIKPFMVAFAYNFLVLKVASTPLNSPKLLILKPLFYAEMVGLFPPLRSLPLKEADCCNSPYCAFAYTIASIGNNISYESGKAKPDWEDTFYSYIDENRPNHNFVTWPKSIDSPKLDHSEPS